MEDKTRDLRIMRNDIEMKKRRLKYKMVDYSYNSKSYNLQYIPIFLLGLVSHLTLGYINDISFAFVDLISMGCMCGSSIAIILANVFYTLPLISYKKEIKKMEKEIKELDCKIEKKLLEAVNEKKKIEEAPKLDYSYNNKLENNDNYQYREVINEESKEQGNAKRLKLNK